MAKKKSTEAIEPIATFGISAIPLLPNEHPSFQEVSEKLEEGTFTSNECPSKSELVSNFSTINTSRLTGYLTNQLVPDQDVVALSSADAFVTISQNQGTTLYITIGSVEYSSGTHQIVIGTPYSVRAIYTGISADLMRLSTGVVISPNVPTNVVFTAQNNSIYVDSYSLSVGESSITINQLGNSNRAVSFSSRKNFAYFSSVTRSGETSWVSVTSTSSSYVYLNVSANSGGDRSASIAFTQVESGLSVSIGVNQVIVMTTVRWDNYTSIEAPPEGGNFTRNLVYYGVLTSGATVTSSAYWLSYTGGQVRVMENNETPEMDRQGTLTITTTNPEITVVSGQNVINITQPFERNFTYEDAELSISPTSTEVEYDYTGDTHINIVCRVDEYMNGVFQGRIDYPYYSVSYNSFGSLVEVTNVSPFVWKARFLGANSSSISRSLEVSFEAFGILRVFTLIQKAAPSSLYSYTVYSDYAGANVYFDYSQFMGNISYGGFTASIEDGDSYYEVSLSGGTLPSDYILSETFTLSASSLSTFSSDGGTNDGTLSSYVDTTTVSYSEPSDGRVYRDSAVYLYCNYSYDTEREELSPTIYSYPSWASVSINRVSSGSYSVSVTVAANDTSSSRSGNIVFTQTGSSKTETLSIYQEAPQVVTYTIYSNWEGATATIGSASGTISGGSFTHHEVGGPPSYSASVSGTLPTRSPDITDHFSLTDPINFPSSGGSESRSIESGRTTITYSYTAPLGSTVYADSSVTLNHTENQSSSSSWVQPSTLASPSWVSSVSIFNTSGYYGTAQISVSPNTSSSPRSDYVSIGGWGSHSDAISVSQDGDSSPIGTVQLSDSSIAFTYLSQNSSVGLVFSNSTVKGTSCSSDSSWLSGSTNDSGNSMYVAVDQNNSGGVRTGVLTLSSTNPHLTVVSPSSLTVTQNSIPIHFVTIDLSSEPGTDGASCYVTISVGGVTKYSGLLDTVFGSSIASVGAREGETVIVSTYSGSFRYGGVWNAGNIMNTNTWEFYTGITIPSISVEYNASITVVP